VNVKDDTKCANCHRDFADHNYVKDSITRYICPDPRVESGYGGFNGGDPRDFHPDAECCSAKELEAHKKACELWDSAEAKGEKPSPERCPSGWIYDDSGKFVAHVLRMPYGIGIYQIRIETEFEADDEQERMEERGDE
jgi:hypothetical protein